MTPSPSTPAPAPAKRTLVLPDPDDLEMPDAWPDGVRLVPTTNFRRAVASVHRTIGKAGITAVSGPSGTGKTTAVCAAAEMAGIPWRRWEVPEELQRTTLEEDVLEVVGRPADPSLGVAILQDLLRAAMKDLEMVLVIDEADRLGFDGAEAIRFARADRNIRMTVILVGHKLDWFMEHNPAIETRLVDWIEFKPLGAWEILGDDEHLSELRQISPLLEQTPDDLLIRINREWAHGLLRLWANLVERCLDLAGDGPSPEKITPKLWKDARDSLGRRNAPR